MDILAEINNIFEIEISELCRVKETLDSNVADVVKAVYSCTGKVVLCGMGKPGHIARKISASMSSLGIHSYVLHPAEAMHGDLGTLSCEDIIIFLSNSGETAEICSILPNIRLIGTPIVAITSNGDSTLAQYADFLICLPEIKEACSLGLAPTSSTTVELVLGDAIAVVVSEMKTIKKENFALFHPAGSLGKKLTLHVRDIMHQGEESPIVISGCCMEFAIIEMCRYGLGAVIVTDSSCHMLGLITDGDLKRYLEKRANIYDLSVDEVMTKSPVFILESVLATKALQLMENRVKQLSVLPVLNEDSQVVGLIRNHDIIKLGIFI